MTRKEIFMMAVQARAIVLDIRMDLTFAATVVSSAGAVPDGSLEAMERDVFLTAAHDYVNRQYGIASKQVKKGKVE